MKSTSRILKWGTVGVVLAIIGIAGVPDDLETWGRWIHTALTVINHNMARWIFVVAALSIFTLIIANLAISDPMLRRRVLENVYSDTLNILEFRDAEPPQPLWRVDDAKPAFTQVECGVQGQQMALKIDGSEYGLDHECGHLSNVELVEFIGKFLERSAMYVKVAATSPGGEKVDLWLSAKRGYRSEPIQISWHEWEIAVEPDRLQGDWESLKIPVYREFAKTFGRLVYRMRAVIGLRLRQKMTIARIRFARCPKSRFPLRAFLLVRKSV